MSCNDQKTTKNEQDITAMDVIEVACTAANAVATAFAGAKVFKSFLKENVNPAKAGKAIGIVSTALSARTLLDGDFVPALAQIIDRAWEAKKNTAALLAEEPAEETVEETVEEAVEKTVEMCAEPIVEKSDVTESSAEEPVVEEAIPVMVQVEDEENEDEGDAEEDSFAGISTAGLDFIDAKAEPEAYAALLEQERQGEIRIVTRYRRSFLSRLVQSQGDVQEYYSEIKNRLLSYKGVKGRISWGNESFNKGRTYIAKVNAKAKTLYLYLALDPETVASLEDGKYNIIDMSSKKKYENVPVLIKVKGPRKLKHALELIDMLCRDTLALPDAKNFTAEDYTVPYQTTEELVDAGAIKMMVAGIPMSDLPAERTEDVDVTAAEI